MSGLEFKLRKNLTISEAHQYLAKSIGTKDGNLSVKYIVNLINDGLLSLYLTPENFSTEIICSVIDDDCIEYIGNGCHLAGEQKIINAYLSTKGNLVILNENTTLLGDLFVNGESEIVQKLARRSDTPEHIKKDVEDTNKYAYKFLMRKNSSLSKSLSVSPDHYGLHIKKLQIDEVIKKLQIDEVLTASQPEQKPNKKSVEYKYKTQDRLILNAITELGYSPTKLPRRDSGKTGIKAKVRKLLDGQGVFEAHNAFNDAWKRLRKYGMEGGIVELK